jgi:hypothetical protein
LTPRRWIAVGAVLTVVGLAVAATAPIPGTTGAEGARSRQMQGGALVLLGWVAFGWGIHRFGRAEEP